MRTEVAIVEIGRALRRRSALSWSVTEESGELSGWIRITAPPERCVGAVPDPDYDRESGSRGSFGFDKDDRLPWLDVNSAHVGGDYLSVRDRLVLAWMLGIRDVGWDGFFVPPAASAREEVVSRARGEFRYELNGGCRVSSAA